MTSNAERDAKVMRLAGLGALGGAGGVTLLWLVFVWVGWMVPTGGLDWVNSRLTWLTTLLPALLIIAVHLVFAWQLLDGAKAVTERGRR